MESRRSLFFVASVVLVAACHSSSSEPGGVHPGVEFSGVLHDLYRLDAINGDTARVYPHDGSTCPSAATKYQWSTLAFSPNGGQPNIAPFVTLAAGWYPLCQVGIVPGGGGQSAAPYTQKESALTLTFFGTTVVTGLLSASGDTVTLSDMPDFRAADPAWTNTAVFTYVVCYAGSVSACQ